MKIHTEPKVYLLSTQTVEEGALQYLKDHGVSDYGTACLSAAESLCEFAGRVCYDSHKNPRPGGNKSYLDRIKEGRHGEVFEFAVYSFLVCGISRPCSQQLTRYRTFSFAQRSGRFVDESEEQEVVLPPALRPAYDAWEDRDYSPEDHALRVWYDEASGSFWKYEDLANGLLAAGHTRKQALEAARSLLPLCLATRVAFIANARALRHAVEQRCHEGADREIRVLFNKILDALREVSPNLFDDYERRALDDGSYVVTTPHRKV